MANTSIRGTSSDGIHVTVGSNAYIIKALIGHRHQILCPRDRKTIGLGMIQDEFKANKRQYRNSFDKQDDGMIKQLLVSLSLSDLVTSIEARFKNVHF